MKTKEPNNQHNNIKNITKKLNKELGKREDKIDIDAVNECFAELNKLQGNGFRKTEAELEADLAEMKRHREKIQAEILKNEMLKNCGMQRKTPSVRKFSAAALSVFLAVSVPFSALAASLGGYSKAFAYVSCSVKEIFNMKPSENTVDGITIIKGEYSKKYSNIEELIIAENIDIFYPSKLPDGIKIKNITYFQFDEEKYEVILALNAINYNIRFSNFHSSNLEVYNGLPTYQTNLGTFYIYSLTKEGKTTYSAFTQNESGEYLVSIDTYENLIFIISNLKKTTN